MLASVKRSSLYYRNDNKKYKKSSTFQTPLELKHRDRSRIVIRLSFLLNYDIYELKTFIVFLLLLLSQCFKPTKEKNQICGQCHKNL